MARVYGVRYVVSFLRLLSAALIAFGYGRCGFAVLFRVLAVSAAVILVAVFLLPQRLPAPQAVPAEA